jgi:hypothetical protein
MLPDHAADTPLTSPVAARDGAAESSPRQPAGSSAPDRWGAAPSVSGLPRPAPAGAERPGSWTPYLLLALPIVCCGGPVLVAAAAAAGVAAWGAVGGAAILVGGIGGLYLWRARRRARDDSGCCQPRTDRWPR